MIHAHLPVFEERNAFLDLTLGLLGVVAVLDRLLEEHAPSVPHVAFGAESVASREETQLGEFVLGAIALRERLVAALEGARSNARKDKILATQSLPRELLR
jgi:hypothetical protein